MNNEEQKLSPVKAFMEDDGRFADRSSSHAEINSEVFEVRREVFKNRMTAVEVIVKAGSRRIASRTETRPPTLHGYQEEMAQARRAADAPAAGLRGMADELKAQYLAADRREMEARRQTLILQLENEKLKTIIETKSNIISKLKKELVTLQRVVKTAATDIWDNPDENIQDSGLELEQDTAFSSKDLFNDHCENENTDDLFNETASTESYAETVARLLKNSEFSIQH